MLSSIRSRFFTRPLLRPHASSYLFSTTPNNVHLRIVFGSQSGTAEAFANELEFDAQEANISAEIIDALKFSAENLVVKKDDSRKVVNAFVVACYGEGEPTDNSKKFFQSLSAIPANETKKLTGSKYAVFGLGNSQCFRDRYNVVGKHLDKRLAEMGGERVVPLGLGDASMTEEGNGSMTNCFNAWKSDLLASIQQQMNSADSTTTTPASTTAEKPADSSEPEISVKLHHKGHHVPLVLSARQRAMIPADRLILQSTVSHVTQLFAKTDEMTATVEVEFDLKNTTPLYPTNSSMPADLKFTNENYTSGLQAGDHIGVFAPNSPHVVDRFALAAGLTEEDLDQVITPADEEPASLRQVLTWQIHLSGIAAITTIKLLHRWLKDQSHLPLTTQLFASLEGQYDVSVREKGIDTADVLDMIPKIPLSSGTTPPKLPIVALLKTLPTLNPRLYSMTHMIVPEDRSLASAAAAAFVTCPVTKQPLLAPVSPTAMDDFTKVTLLSRLVRYRQTKSSRNRVIDGVCSTYLNERLVPSNSNVAIFFRESNFHLPAPLPIPITASSNTCPPPVIMIAGGSGLAPFMSFLEERQRQIHNPKIAIGPAYLFYGCRTKEEYIFREKLVGYLGSQQKDKDEVKHASHALDSLIVSFSSAGNETNNIALETSLHAREIIHPQAGHIPNVFQSHAQQAELLSIIRNGAHIYVCGGAGLFGKAVREVINAVAIQAFDLPKPTNASDQSGIRHLVQLKRYFEDLAD